MAGGFKRSSRFGVIGVLVVMVAVAIVGLTMGSGQDANPKLVLGIVFGIVAVFFVVLFALQRSDLERTAGTDKRLTERAVAEGGQPIDNPTTMEDPELWAALAVKPIDREAVKARSEMWGVARQSLSLGVVITALIFLTVPPIYFFESFVPLMIGGPLIAIAAIYGSVRAVGPGSQMDQGYENVGRAMAPLALEVTERPTVSIETRDAVSGRVGPKIHGALQLEGERHGRPVSIRIAGGESEISVGAASPEFSAKARDGKVRPAKDAPEAITAALENVANSTRWKRLEVEGGPEGIVVVRKGGGQSDWLCDLWLAERLADA
jgi:hypothetical protein